MKRAVLFAALAALCVFTSCITLAPLPDSAITQYVREQAINRNVIVQYEGNVGGDYCSGFIYKTNVVLAAGHCFGTNLTANGVPAKIIRRWDEPDGDLIALAVPTREFPALRFADPQPGDFVFSIANRAPWVDVFNYGYVARVEDGYVCATILAVPGFSGSALYTRDGRLVGVASRMNSARTSYTNDDGSSWNAAIPMWSWAVSGKTLRKFIAEAKL